MAMTDEKQTILDDNIQSLSIGVDTRKKFAVEGDLTRIIRIDTQDLNVINRLRNAIDKMESVETKFNELAAKSNEIDQKRNADGEFDVSIDELTADTTEFSDKFMALEIEMRNLVDGIFNSPGTCDVILEDSSIFSPVNGKLKYEQIIDTLIGLYETNLTAEVAKINREKIKAKTAKYTNKRKR